MKKMLSALLCIMLLPCMTLAQGNLQRKPTKPGGGKTKPSVQTQNTIRGYEYVDLGLPSKLKWATCNVGASKPSQSGNKYTWACFTPDLYSDDGEYAPANISGDSRFDAARALWGATWRTPTLEEWRELMTCKWTWSRLDGVVGYKVTGPKGTYIFLPVTDDEHGAYWSATADKETEGAYEMLFEREYYEPGLTLYSFFCNIRPVSK